MDRLFAATPKQAVTNKRAISRVAVFGSRQLLGQAEAAFKDRKPLVSVSFIDDGRKNLRAGLAQGLAAPEKTLVISGTDSDRGVKFELVAQELRGIAGKAAFALFTSEPRALGLASEFESFVSGRGFGPSALRNVDYVFRSGASEEGYWDEKDVLRAALVVHEDRMNFRLDRENAILVVEDKPGKFTEFIMMLYGSQRSSRLLHARTFEEAMGLVGEAGDRLVDAIVDMRFPKGGKLDENAYQEVKAALLSASPDMPVVLTSGDEARANAAAASGEFALWDHDPQFFRKLGQHLSEYSGIGPFIFRDENGSQVFRADDFAKFCLFLGLTHKHLDSVLRHAEKNHYSKWLARHGYDEAALRFDAIARDYRYIFSAMLEQKEMMRSNLAGVLLPCLGKEDKRLISLILAFGLEPDGRYGPAIIRDPFIDYRLAESKAYLERQIALAQREISVGERRNTPAGEKLKLGGHNSLKYYSRLLDEQIQSMRQSSALASSPEQLFCG